MSPVFSVCGNPQLPRPCWATQWLTHNLKSVFVGVWCTCLCECAPESVFVCVLCVWSLDRLLVVCVWVYKCVQLLLEALFYAIRTHVQASCCLIFHNCFVRPGEKLTIKGKWSQSFCGLKYIHVSVCTTVLVCVCLAVTFDIHSCSPLTLLTSPRTHQT